MDISWVVGTVILLLLPFQWFTYAGKNIILAIALGVGLFAYLQFKGLQHNAQQL